jgi:hypothetical protein
MTVKTYPVPNTGYTGTPVPYSGANMDPLSIGLGIGKTILGGIFGSHSAREANKMRIELAREQMRFQKRMRDTGFQAAAKDLEKAGLNRILALGKPAPSPGGAMPQIENEGQAGLNAALSIARQHAEIENINATTAKTVAETERTGWETENVRQTYEKIFREIDNLRKDGLIKDVMLEVQTKLRNIKGHEEAIIKSEADLWRELDDLSLDEGTWLIRLVGPTAAPLIKLFLHSNRRK